MYSNIYSLQEPRNISWTNFVVCVKSKNKPPLFTLKTKCSNMYWLFFLLTLLTFHEVFYLHTKNDVIRNEMNFIAHLFLRDWHLSSPYYLCKTHFWKFNGFSGKGFLIPLNKVEPNDEINNFVELLILFNNICCWMHSFLDLLLLWSY